MAELILPAARYKDSFYEAVAEFAAEGVEEGPNIGQGFDAYLGVLERFAKGINLREGWVPATDYWLVEGDEYIGRISIRHRLNEKLSIVGGHIGYNIRPGKRRLGYGTTMLRLALPKAKTLGITRALVTCDETNIGSRKIIESNGGILENKVSLPGSDVPKLRFWIDL